VDDGFCSAEGRLDGFSTLREPPDRIVVARQDALSGAFPEDPRALTQDFYTRFYHVTPTSAQIDHVLEHFHGE
jgi:hypothetical protein